MGDREDTLRWLRGADCRAVTTAERRIVERLVLEGRAQWVDTSRTRAAAGRDAGTGRLRALGVPVQVCPVCGGKGAYTPVGTSLALDATCTACGWHFTTASRRALLAALTRPDGQ